MLIARNKNSDTINRIVVEWILSTTSLLYPIQFIQKNNQVTRKSENDYFQVQGLKFEWKTIQNAAGFYTSCPSRWEIQILQGSRRNTKYVIIHIQILLQQPKVSNSRLYTKVYSNTATAAEVSLQWPKIIYICAHAHSNATQ